MIDTSQMDPLWVFIFTFVPMAVSASLLRAKGVTGLLAITAAVSIALVVFMDFHDFKLILGAIAGWLGLFVGGKISDLREQAKMRRAAEVEKQRRKSMLQSR
jgi:hypothetical protein